MIAEAAIPTLTYASGQIIPIEEVQVNGQYKENNAPWSYRTNRKDFVGPLTFSISSIKTSVTAPSIDFAIDLGSNLQIGQTATINKDFVVNGHTVRLLSVVRETIPDSCQGVGINFNFSADAPGIFAGVGDVVPPEPMSCSGGGGGGGGAVRIEGYDVTLNTVTANGGSTAGFGRIAVYYAHTFTGNFTPGYQQNTSTGQGSTPTPTPAPIIQTPQPPAAGWVGTGYTYTAAHPHAATALSGGTMGGSAYAYDANGNMTCRTESGVTYKQSYNAENRLATVQKLLSGTCAAPGQIATQWDFAYDGDGTRVKQIVSTYDQSTPQNITGIAITAYFMGGAYEANVNTSGAELSAKKYYSIAGMTVAMNDGGTMKYLLTDHLGSVVAVTNASGALLSQQRYLPFGQVRADVKQPIPNSPITQTDFGYTGQRSLNMGLMDYHARMYDAYLNRFIQPDTITPGGPQGLNRFSYVNNNPVLYNDPSGHCPICLIAILVVGAMILSGDNVHGASTTAPMPFGDIIPDANYTSYTVAASTTGMEALGIDDDHNIGTDYLIGGVDIVETKKTNRLFPISVSESHMPKVYFL